MGSDVPQRRRDPGIGGNPSVVAPATTSASSDRGDAEDPGLAFDDPVTPDHVRKARGSTAMSRERWMGLLFGIGSTCFLVGPFPGYAQLVGAAATG